MDINMLVDMDSTTRISQGNSDPGLAQYLATTAGSLQVDVNVAGTRDQWGESPLTPLSYMWSDDDSYKYTHHEYEKYPAASIGHEGDFDLSDPSSLTPGASSINSDSDSQHSEGNGLAKRTQSALHQGTTLAGNASSAALSNTLMNPEYPASFTSQQTMAAYHDHQVSSNILHDPLMMLEASHTRRHTSSDSRNVFPLTPLPQQRDRSNTNPSAHRTAPIFFPPNGLKAHVEPNQNLFAAVANFTSPFASSHSVSGLTFSVSQPLLPFPSSSSGFGYDLATPQGTPRAGEGSLPVLGRGLLGWGDDDTPKPAHGKRSHSRSVSPLLGGFDISMVSSPSRDSKARAAKRARVSSTKKLVGDSNTEESASISSSDAESDVYIPSRSPSFAPSRSASPHEGFRRRDTGVGKKKATKGKAKGSAACALALISRLTSTGTGTGSSVGDDGDSEYTGSTEGSGTMRKRKNSHIPLPVPVPNLIKKSRGRKVPFVAPQGMVEAAAPVRAKRGRKNLAATATVDVDGIETMTIGPDGGNRTYVCAVAGCGKCFVRGEHLKRHVRSIHTHDKPHRCPFKGCDKSFSRRDNLGQHVRIHLQTPDAQSD